MYKGNLAATDFKIKLVSLATSHLEGDKEVFETYTAHENNINKNGRIVCSLSEDDIYTLVLQPEHFTNNYYFKIEFEITPFIKDQQNNTIFMSPSREKVVIIKNYKKLSEQENSNNRTPKEEYAVLLQNGFFVHGQAGVFDEINNLDLSQDNNITPTK